MSEPTGRPALLLDPEMLRRLGRLDLIGRVIADALRQGLRRSRLQGFSTEFSDFKPYTPGDDLRFLDWRIFARTDRLLVRLYEAETSFESMLLLDASPSMAWRWESTVSKLEYGANLLAAIACLHVESQDAVGLAVDDGTETAVLPPRSSRRQLEKIFAMLEGLRPGPGAAIPRLVRALEPLRKHRGLVVLCSDLEEDRESVERALEALAGRDDEVLVLHLLDRAEVEVPFGAVTHLEDSETGEVLPVDPVRLRAVQADTVRKFRDVWRSACEGWGIRYHALDTGMDYGEALLGIAAKSRKVKDPWQHDSS